MNSVGNSQDVSADRYQRLEDDVLLQEKADSLISHLVQVIPMFSEYRKERLGGLKIVFLLCLKDRSAISDFIRLCRIEAMCRSKHLRQFREGGRI